MQTQYIILAVMNVAFWALNSILAGVNFGQHRYWWAGFNFLTAMLCWFAFMVCINHK